MERMCIYMYIYNMYINVILSLFNFIILSLCVSFYTVCVCTCEGQKLVWGYKSRSTSL